LLAFADWAKLVVMALIVAGVLWSLAWALSAASLAYERWLQRLLRSQRSFQPHLLKAL